MNINSIEDIRRYVEEHGDYIACVWGEMLFDMDKFNAEYSLQDFLEGADIAIGRGKVTIGDILDAKEMGL